MQVSGAASMFASTAPQGAAATGSAGLAGDIGKPSAEAEFLEYARMTPAQRLRQQILDSLGLTEKDVQAMDSKARKAVEEKINEMIKAKIEGDPHARPGALVDVQA
jgi:hypothetical protein